MIDTWRQRENAEKRVTGNNKKMALAVIMLHACPLDTYVCHTTTKSLPCTSFFPFYSAALDWSHLPLRTYRLYQQNIISKPEKNLSSKHFHHGQQGHSCQRQPLRQRSFRWHCHYQPWLELVFCTWTSYFLSSFKASVRIASLTAGMTRPLLLLCSSQHWPSLGCPSPGLVRIAFSTISQLPSL